MLKTKQNKKKYKLKTSNLRCSQGQFPFPSILGHKQSVFWPLQPYCRADKRAPDSAGPLGSVILLRDIPTPHSIKKLPVKRSVSALNATLKYCRVPGDSFLTAGEGRVVELCYTAERESSDRQELSFMARYRLGLPACPPVLESHHLLFFTKTARPQRR